MITHIVGDYRVRMGVDGRVQVLATRGGALRAVGLGTLVPGGVLWNDLDPGEVHQELTSVVRTVCDG